MVVGVLEAFHLVLFAWHFHCIRAVYGMAQATNQQQKWKLESDTCDITNDQWKLITWYFQRAPHVEITEIFANHSAANGQGRSQFGNDVAKEFTIRINKIVQTQSVDYDTEDNVTDTQKFGWRGQRFDRRSYSNDGVTPKRPSPQDIGVIRGRDTAAEVRLRAEMMNGTRVDSPTHGSLILVECSNLIDDYIFGYPRRPFRRPRANFIIIAYKLESPMAWDVTASRILARLWRKYGVLNAIILSTCNPNDVIIFAIFQSL